MSPRPRRFLGLALIAGLLIGLAPAPPRAEAADLAVAAAEARLVTLLNAERQKLGLVPVRVDSRLMTLARARSTDMAVNDYLSHTQPDGRSIFDMLRPAGITWYAAGEIIGWNTWSTLGDSAAAITRAWMKSDGHRKVLVSATYNYVGVGLAVDPSGKKYWTAVFMQGPDRSGGWVRFYPFVTLSTTSGWRTGYVNWRGDDTLLQTLTAGFHRFQVQQRADGSAWDWVTKSTTSGKVKVTVRKGHRSDVRVRTCDRNWTCGGWVSYSVTG